MMKYSRPICMSVYNGLPSARYIVNAHTDLPLVFYPLHRDLPLLFHFYLLRIELKWFKIWKMRITYTLATDVSYHKAVRK